MRTADEATVRRLDGLVLVWLVLWIVIGGWAGYTLWQLSELGDTVTTSGEAIRSTGEALESLADVPVVGDRTRELGAEAVAAGEDIALRGQEVQSQLRVLSVLLGPTIAILPAAPVLGFYLPMRYARRRDVAEVRWLLSSTSVNPAVADRYLAERAVHLLAPATVLGIDGDPWGALVEGHTRALADAELQRLGLVRG